MLAWHKSWHSHRPMFARLLDMSSLFSSSCACVRALQARGCICLWQLYKPTRNAHLENAEWNNELLKSSPNITLTTESLVSFKRERGKMCWQFTVDSSQTGRRKICMGLLQTINKLQRHKREGKKKKKRKMKPCWRKQISDNSVQRLLRRDAHLWGFFVGSLQGRTRWPQYWERFVRGGMFWQYLLGPGFMLQCDNRGASDTQLCSLSLPRRGRILKHLRFHHVNLNQTLSQ